MAQVCGFLCAGAEPLFKKKEMAQMPQVPGGSVANPVVMGAATATAMPMQPMTATATAMPTVQPAVATATATAMPTVQPVVATANPV